MDYLTTVLDGEKPGRDHCCAGGYLFMAHDMDDVIALFQTEILAHSACLTVKSVNLMAKSVRKKILGCFKIEPGLKI